MCRHNINYPEITHLAFPGTIEPLKSGQTGRKSKFPDFLVLRKCADSCEEMSRKVYSICPNTKEET